MTSRLHLAFTTPTWLAMASIGGSLAAVYGLGYGTPRENFPEVLAWFALAFLAYFLQIRSKLSLGHGLLLALAFRLVLLFSVPALSDDFFRFLWDGHLLQNGENPFLSLPSQWMASGAPLLPGLSQELYQGLNSANYYSIYPPICQAVFWLSTWLDGSILTGVVIMRLCLLLAEAGTLWLLPKLLRQIGLPTRQALWYALNPAIILELTGNLHFEALVVFFLVGAFYLLTLQRWVLAAVFLGLAVGSKLLPLLLLPLLPHFLGWRRAFLLGLVAGLVVVLLFAPFLSLELFLHLGNSLQLYFQKFEFNASFYYLLRGLGQWVMGFNPISYLGPALSVLTIMSALWLGFFFQQNRREAGSLILKSLLLFTLYLLFATIVHPWYISTLVALAACTRLRYPMVWSGMAVLSYAAYQHADYQENLWLVALEYLVVLGFLLCEVKKGQGDLAGLQETAPAAAPLV